MSAHERVIYFQAMANAREAGRRLSIYGTQFPRQCPIHSASTVCTIGLEVPIVLSLFFIRFLLSSGSSFCRSTVTIALVRLEPLP